MSYSRIAWMALFGLFFGLVLIGTGGDVAYRTANVFMWSTLLAIFVASVSFDWM